MNLSNLDKAVSLRQQLQNVRKQLSGARIGGVTITGYGTSLNVTKETSSAVQTLILADLEKQETSFVAELGKLGVTESANGAAYEGGGVSKGKLDDAILASIIMGPMLGELRSHGRRG
ncbi:hypothetical protein NKH72_21820 [Mesorhizobium sp. M0955]|uniref:hypothetical protein n=1 Tax=Mesorhizobium sp. M0955 TaxID=2957033 RepID=UPI003339BDE2